MHPAFSFGSLRSATLALALAACRTTASAPTDASDAPSTSTGGSRDAMTDARPAHTIERVTFRTLDGWTIVGDLSRGHGDDAVVLVHQLSSNRHEWAPLLERLDGGAQPLTTLSIDLRGHGDSVAGPDGATTWQSFGNTRERWAGIVTDVAAAVRFLRDSPAPPRHIVIVGSSIGSSAALIAASQDHGVTGVVMLSPGVAYHGLDTLGPMRDYVATGRRALLVASEGDTTSANAVAQLSSLASEHPDAGGTATEVYPGTGAHGVSIGAQGVHPELWARTESWIRDAFATAPR